MSEETRDAKYFGARIGEKCWLGKTELKITQVLIYSTGNFRVTLIDLEKQFYCENGEGITFEAPKKIVRKEIDCWMRKTWNCEKNKPLVEVFTEVPDYLDRIGIRYHSAKLTWEEIL